MDLPSLSSKLVLFFFIVLRLQYPQLDPVVEYTKDAADGRFYAKLTMYRDSLKIPALGFNFCLVKLWINQKPLWTSQQGNEEESSSPAKKPMPPGRQELQGLRVGREYYSTFLKIGR